MKTQTNELKQILAELGITEVGTIQEMPSETGTMINDRPDRDVGH